MNDMTLGALCEKAKEFARENELALTCKVRQPNKRSDVWWADFLINKTWITFRWSLQSGFIVNDNMASGSSEILYEDEPVFKTKHGGEAYNKVVEFLSKEIGVKLHEENKFTIVSISNCLVLDID